MYSSKECFKCGKEKTLMNFYKHPEMADGHLNKCKDCSKIDTKKNRDNNIDYYSEYDRQRANNPNRMAARFSYSKTENRKKAAIKSKIKWIQNNKIKRAAHVIYGNFIRNNKDLIKNECEMCGERKKRLNAHHDDYNYPLTVRYLCGLCHSKWHKENGSGII